MDKIKISKSLEERIKYLVNYYDNDKNEVIRIHNGEAWNDQYIEVNELAPLELAQILLGHYEVELTEQDLDNTFRFKIGITGTEYLAMKLNGRYAVAWIEDSKPMMSHHSIESVIRFISSNAWEVL